MDHVRLQLVMGRNKESEPKKAINVNFVNKLNFDFQCKTYTEYKAHDIAAPKIHISPSTKFKFISVDNLPFEITTSTPINANKKPIDCKKFIFSL